MSIENRIKEIKKYFPVMKVVKCYIGTGKLVTIYRGKKNITLFLSGIDEIIKLGLAEVEIGSVSKHFNKIVELDNNVKEAQKVFNNKIRDYSNFIDNNVKKWY